MLFNMSQEVAVIIYAIAVAATIGVIVYYIEN